MNQVKKPSFRLLLFNKDDILLVTSKEEDLQPIYDMTQDIVCKNGLIITLKCTKIRYCTMFGTTGYQSNFYATKNIHTQNNLKKQLTFRSFQGVFNWIHSTLGMPSYALTIILFKNFRRFPCTVLGYYEARKQLQLFETRLEEAFVYCEGALLPLNLFSSVTYLLQVLYIVPEDGKFTPQWSQNTKCFPYSSCCIILTPKNQCLRV